MTTTKYNYDDLRKLMSKDRSCCVIHGKVYDFTDFIPKHPGGSIIRTAIGRDASVLYETHHNLLDMKKVNMILDKYCIGEVENYVPIAKFDSPFATTMLARCREALKGVSHRESLYSYSSILTTIVILTVLWYLAYQYGYWWLTPLIGLMMAVGHSTGHCANHHGFSETSWVNQVLSLLFTNSWGLYEKNWEFSHIISHHCYNYTDKDYIIEQHVPVKFYRIRECDPWTPLHQYQTWFYFFSHIFAFFIGGVRLDCAPWIFVAPLIRWLDVHVNKTFPAPQFFAYGSNIEKNELGPTEDGVGPKKYFIFYESYDHLVTIVMSNMIWLPLFLRLWSMHGLLYAVCFNTACFGFQAARITKTLLLQHTCEGVKLTPEYTPEQDWYAAQVESSVTMLLSPLLLFIGHGLNYQIEHHMFPCANPLVLQKLQPIVEKTAKEFGVDYHVFPSERAAMQSVYKHMAKMAVKPSEK